MKIAIPVERESMETQISPSFGRAPYFLIYDPESKNSLFVENSAAASPGGAGIKAAQIIIDSGAEALLAPRCGQNAAEVFEAADLKIYKTVGVLAQDNIKAFAEGRLAVLEEIHEGFHGRHEL